MGPRSALLLEDPRESFSELVLGLLVETDVLEVGYVLGDNPVDGEDWYLFASAPVDLLALEAVVEP